MAKDAGLSRAKAANIAADTTMQARASLAPLWPIAETTSAATAIISAMPAMTGTSESAARMQAAMQKGLARARPPEGFLGLSPRGLQGFRQAVALCPVALCLL